MPSSQEEMSRAVSASPNAYGRWERGETDFVLDEGEFLRLLAVHGLTASDLRRLVTSVEKGRAPETAVDALLSQRRVAHVRRSRSWRWNQRARVSRWVTLRRSEGLWSERPDT